MLFQWCVRNIMLEYAKNIQIIGQITPQYESILTTGALKFLSALSKKFEEQRQSLLQKRKERQQRINSGEKLHFLDETADIRNNSHWKCAPIPKDLQDRRVEITGPPERKMVINALNSGAKVFMADFEDSNAPTWENCLNGQINLRDAINRTIAHHNPITNKFYQLNSKVATLFVRPRGWHLEEKHLVINNSPISASLFDFGLYFYHNAKNLIQKNTAPYFYLPKLESHLEARLWNDVFNFAQSYLEIPHGTIRATVLIETLPASFEMEEILYELKDHSAGLNCGRWDYIFSYIKVFQEAEDHILPDRGQVTMTQHFLNSYVQLLIQTCHRRGVHAMGGMAAQIPIKQDKIANDFALDKVKQDKLREVQAGHDGTWVAHPGLVPIAMEIFDEYMPTENQIRKITDYEIQEEDLLKLPEGTITESGLRANINVGIRYLEAWLRGIGCVPINHLMEDAATAEISRTQVWQWVRYQAELDDGRVLTKMLVEEIIQEELQEILEAIGEEEYLSGKYRLAAQLFSKLVFGYTCADFLTSIAYGHI